MKKTLVLTAAVLIAGCAGGEPRIQQGPDAETTFDGLVRIDNAAFRDAWIDPDVELKGYNKVILGLAAFEFRAVKKTPEFSSIRTDNRREYYISDKDREKLVELVTEVFADELGKSKNFTVVTEPAADTLIIVGMLHDIVSRVPPRLIGTGEIYLASVGEATLILEARDSLSGETIYRAVERRAIERPGLDAIEVTPVTTWAEVRRWARRWATRLREGLDSIHD